MFFLRMIVVALFVAFAWESQAEAAEHPEEYVEWGPVYLDVPYELIVLSFKVDNQWVSELRDCTLLPGGSLTPYPFEISYEVMAFRYVPSYIPAAPLDECEIDELVFLRTSDFIELLSLMTPYSSLSACYDPSSCA